MKARFGTPLRILAAAVAMSAAVAHTTLQAQSASGSVVTLSSAERGVTVKVTPQPLAAGAADWAFAVVLDTRSGSLDDDLVQSAVLWVDGQEFRPVQWTGSAAGGHHREGILRFPAPPRAPDSTEMRLQRVNEDVPRVFRWDGAELR